MNRNNAQKLVQAYNELEGYEYQLKHVMNSRLTAKATLSFNNEQGMWRELQSIPKGVVEQLLRTWYLEDLRLKIGAKKALIQSLGGELP